MDSDLAGKILIAAVAIVASALGAGLSHFFSGRRETRLERWKARDRYLEDVEAFNSAVAVFRTFLSTHTARELQHMPSAVEIPGEPFIPDAYRAVMDPVHQMGTLAHAALVALDASQETRTLIPKMIGLIGQIQAEHGTDDGTSRETNIAIMDGIADIRKAVLHVKDEYLGGSPPSFKVSLKRFFRRGG